MSTAIPDNLIIADSFADLPAQMRYVIFGVDERSKLLRAIMAVSLPAAEFVDFVTSIEARPQDPEIYTIIVDPDYPDHIAGLPAERFARLIVMAVPESDPWGYWDILGEHPELCAAKLSGAEFAAFLVKERPSFWFNRDGHIQYAMGAYPFSFPNFIQENLGKVNFILANLSNQQSSSNFHTLLYGTPQLMWRQFLHNIFRNNQYMNYTRIEPGDVILNCGIASGFELPFFLNRLRGRGRIINVDPLGERYLCDYARGYARHFRDLLEPHDVALATYDGEMKMRVANEDGSGTSSFHVPEDDPALVAFPCLTVETVLQRAGVEKLDLIKMDLEGAEVALLPDVVAAMKKYRPQLAISIYHMIEHMIEVPHFLMTSLEEYNFYIVSYGYERYETVFYCIPQEKEMTARGIYIDL